MYEVTKTQLATHHGAIVPASTSGKPTSHSSRQRTMWRDMVGGSGDEKRRSQLPTIVSSSRTSSSSLRCRCVGRLPARNCACSSRRSAPSSSSGLDRWGPIQAASCSGSIAVSTSSSSVSTGPVSLAASSHANAAR